MRIDARSGVLLRLPNWLGDLVAVEPAVRALHRAVVEDADGALTLVAPRRLLTLFDGRFDGARRWAVEDGVSGWRGHGTAVLFTGSWRSAWTAVRAGIGVRVGQARDGRGLLLTAGARPALERGAVALSTRRPGSWPRYAPRAVAAVAGELSGLVGVAVADPVPRLVPRPDAAASVERELEHLGGRPFTLLNAGGRSGSAKALATDEWMRALAGHRSDVPFVLAFGPGEETGARALAQSLAANGRIAHAFAQGQRAPTLHEYLALLARSQRFVTTDTGPRHLARALGTPTVVLFGPTDPRHTLSDARGSERLVQGAASCAPCHLERCPLTGADERACLRDAADRFATLRP
ncbi:ADP-heptose:LPS heptosyl transferase I [Planctomycetes bacterium Pla163]|uniref:ADP-heptose:LPS heptosyl transferase I n=1 Tax=Rohdeia mirabilis TaxID=2528008 RepID=A0A518D335_9BACT|nr:ADP-heptose:LPS heptosyl transferase I [Planctomycetes bacterium Pla163]